MENSYDVVIMGGGLAGLSLALHLRQESDSLSIAVLEKTADACPKSVHKVGESTVEISAIYLAKHLGLKQHLQDAHLRKLGLRCFFSSNNNQKIDERIELGSSIWPPVDSYQLDRGTLENHLRELCQTSDIALMLGANIIEIELAEQHAKESGNDKAACHQVHFKRGLIESSIAGRWLVDATGRRALLKTKLKLKQEAPLRHSSSWMRIDDVINVDSWSSSPDWPLSATGPLDRYNSTNHLMGKGYWVWIIPLSSGATSIGVVADEQYYPISQFNSFEKVLEFLHSHEPRCAQEIEKRRDLLLDFSSLKHFSRKTSRFYSPDRWAICGDAGAFIDPLYSFGNDFIAIGNTFIVEMIKSDLLESEDIALTSEIYNGILLDFIDHTFKIFDNQYHVLGHNRMMPIKIIWDFAVYWSFFAYFFANRCIANIPLLLRNRDNLSRLEKLNNEIQQFFAASTEGIPQAPGRGIVEILKIPYLYQLQEELNHPVDESTFCRRFEYKLTELEEISEEIKGWSSQFITSNAVVTEAHSNPATKFTYLRQAFDVLS